MFTKKTLIILLSFLVTKSVQAQNASFFTPTTAAKIIQSEGMVASGLPQKFDAYQLDEAGLRAVLETAPWEFTPEAKQRRCVISVPTAHAQIEQFSVWRTDMMEQELAEACPYLRTYAGVSLSDPRRTLRFSTTLRGFKAMILQPDAAPAMVQPVANLYMAYSWADVPGATHADLQLCATQDSEVTLGDLKLDQAPASERGEGNPVRLKVYRFCVAGTGEFTQDHGGTKPLALSAIMEYVNIVSAVTERDLDVRLKLTASSEFVIFTNPDTDPYNQGPTVQDYMSQNPAVLNQYTNFNSYDLGHVFTRYITGGAIGVAGGNACGGNKGAGCSAGNLGASGDYGAGFHGVLAHEVGHQLSAGHTWNRCNGGGGRAGTSAFEPGSGSTIMSYAGSCQADNIQFNSNFYYHAGTIEQIGTFTNLPGSCGTYESNGNNAPLVTHNYQNGFSIPISTAFELNGAATDADGDPISYAWEGLDLGPETPLGEPIGNTAIFRTWPATDATNRYFPRLSVILGNGFDPAEQLPTYSRNLTFRLIARDNKPGGGGVGWADVAFKATASAGPFLVISPNASNDIWRVGELTEVRWDVANTTAAPVNCQIVNIRLSKDGGQTYPITLASATENDGSHYVLVPNELTNNARIRVEAADNVFLDISNANFKIQAPVQPSLTMGLSADASTVCLPENYATEIYTASVLGYNTPVALDVLGNLPPGATASFSATNINPGESSTFSLNLESVTVEGSFDFTIRAISGTDTLLRPVSILLRRNDFTGFALQWPINGTTNAVLSQTLRWGKGLDADSYDVQFSDSPAFTTILASVSSTTLDTFKINFLLEKGKAYFWRVRTRNLCGAHEWSAPSFFSTFAEDCLTFNANDLPKSIPANGTPSVESKITVVQGGQISDLVVGKIEGYHEYFRDLEVRLISPQGTEVLLFKDRCSNFNGSFNFGLSDAAPGFFPCPPPNNGTIHRPVNALAPIIGQNSTGVWTLRVKDNVSGSGGILSNFNLQFCQSLDVQPPYLVNNIVMPLPSGTNRVISPDFLLVQDPNNFNYQLIYTLMTVPEHGYVAKDGLGELQPGDQFTQADIDGGVIRFFDYGFNAGPDGFMFMVTDGEGGFFGTPMFVAQPLVNNKEVAFKAIDFRVFPNPASSSVWVAFGQALESNARLSLFNMSGQLLQNQQMAIGQEQMQLELNQLPKGVYIVRVETETGAGVRKLVVE